MSTTGIDNGSHTGDTTLLDDFIHLTSPKATRTTEDLDNVDSPTHRHGATVAKVPPARKRDRSLAKSLLAASNTLMAAGKLLADAAELVMDSSESDWGTE